MSSQIEKWWRGIARWKRFLLCMGASVLFANGILISIFYSYQFINSIVLFMGFFGIYGTLIGLPIFLASLYHSSESESGFEGFIFGIFLNAFQLASVFKLGWLKSISLETIRVETYFLDYTTLYLLLIPITLFIIPISHSIYRKIKPLKPDDVPLIKFNKFYFKLCCLGILFFVRAFFFYLGGMAMLLVIFAYIVVDWFLFKPIDNQLKEQGRVKRIMHFMAYSALFFMNGWVSCYFSLTSVFTTNKPSDTSMFFIPDDVWTYLNPTTLMFLNLIAGAIYVGFGFSRMTNLKERSYNQKLKKAKQAVAKAEKLEEEGDLLGALESYLDAAGLIPKESASEIEHCLVKARTLFERYITLLIMKDQDITALEFIQKFLPKRKHILKWSHAEYLLKLINERDTDTLVEIFLKNTPEGQRFIHYIKKQGKVYLHELARTFGFEESRIRKAFTFILQKNIIDGFMAHDWSYFITRAELRKTLERKLEENSEEEQINMISKDTKLISIPGDHQETHFQKMSIRENNDSCSLKFGDIVIGKIQEITDDGWVIDINSPRPAMLQVSDFSPARTLERNKLLKILNIGDLIIAKFRSYEQNFAQLTVNEPGLGKIPHGKLVEINPANIPRLIGKNGSMISMIKQETGCHILIGLNGYIVVYGKNPKCENLAIMAIRKIDKEALVAGLKDKVYQLIKEMK
ncbi:MAG: KH domain-containing protein [Candidatus Bathyarchaeia archaeon]